MNNTDVDINAESVNDRAKIMLHRIVAHRIAQRPDLIAVARSKLEVTSHSADYLSDWLEILCRDPFEVRQLITSRTEKMVRLRQSSPLSQPDFQDPDFRRRVWKLARKGTNNTRALEV